MSTQRPYLFICCLGLCFLLFSCKNESPKPLLTADFFIRYDYSNNEFKSEARFKDKLGAVSALPENPTINAKAMEELRVPDAIYMLKEQSNFLQQYKLHWRDVSGDTVTMAASIHPILNFDFSEERLSSQSSATMTWEGEPLSANESLIFLWEKEGETVTMQSVNATNGSSMVLPSAEMQKLNSGQWSLYLVRKQRTEATDSPFKVTIMVEFYTKVKSFEVY